MSIFDVFKKKKDEGKECQVSEANMGHKDSITPDEKSTLKGAAEPKETTEPNEVRVFNLIILDESGSMSAIYQPALTGVNETLQTIREAQKEHPNQKHFASLIAFDSGHYNEIYHTTPAEKAVDITSEQYRPCGCTPLYDAMGRAITELRPKVNADDVVLVTIITDGYENASREYNGKVIKALVEEMKSKGWIFTYIGANQDVEAVAASLAINNHLQFEATSAGAGVMFAKECRSRKKFFEKLDTSSDRSTISENYFDDEPY